MQWLVSIAVVLAVGAAATFIIRGVLQRRDEAAGGIEALSDMSWRSFITLVLDALARRGFSRVVDREAPSGDGDFTLARDGAHFLLACKHGSAFVLGRRDVDEVAAAMRMQGAAGGLLVTQGRVADDARAPARREQVELLDGPTLWPELRALVPASLLDELGATAAARARQRTLAAWLLALVAGVAVFTALSPFRRDAALDAGATLTPAAELSPRRDAPAAAVAPVPDRYPDDATLEQQRADIASAVSTLAMVDRVIWSTSSTMEVFLASVDADHDPFTAICPLIERYPALAASRIQLTPPHGHDAQVRFRQCRNY
ncbi:restriction endonuclease [Luteimonas sp. MC1572]|uniref:restriction endonuclease n=1 Tax=Luteimonas sp. MC1572 TaxID=2799325 RepID=UPI0018F0EEA5|nr:restriction endonuclease [Luteimonas sp. MC1572]MBJ6980491.1 restriction endonuclease [Luteimonas sp. MC1572]QQO04368.1 restriction endonuclease [Luteimonas sp. MC1572]